MNYKNLAEMFEASSVRFSNRPAFAWYDAHNQLHEKSYGDLYRDATYLARALVALGVESREHVGLLSDNRYEWMVADWAVIFCGAADVPRGADITDSEITYILSHAQIKILFLENEKLFERIQNLRHSLPLLKSVIVMDPGARENPEFTRMQDLIIRGADLPPESVEERVAQIRPEHLFTLIYTSGTTGAPKGVMLTHANMCSQISRMPFVPRPGDRILSILPVWHIFERVFEMIAIAGGACTYYTNVRNLREDLKRVKPSFMASAPRLWESIYSGIQSNVQKASGFARFLFRSAIFLAREVRGGIRFLRGGELDLRGRNPLISFVRALWTLFKIVCLMLPFAVLDFLVLRKIRAATGGHLRGSVSGGGALPLHIDTFFNDIGIPVLEGYGMTETSPVIAVRTWKSLVPGTVGPLYPDTHIRIVDPASGARVFDSQNPKVGRGKKGEIHVRGPQVMAGYFKNPEATAGVLSDGWLNTGDLGMMTFNNCLKITGRSKETIVLMGGENVEPTPIESRLLQSAFIDQVMVVGQDRKTLGALIVPNRSAFDNEEYERIVASMEAQATIRKEVQSLINAESGFKSFERVVVFSLVPGPFVVGDELTAKLSLKRHRIAEKHAELIESMYS